MQLLSQSSYQGIRNTSGILHTFYRFLYGGEKERGGQATEITQNHGDHTERA